MQTRKRSFYESLSVTAIGLGYAIPLNYVMINKMQWESAWVQSVSITVVFTLLSIILKYVSRRFFNWLDHGEHRHGSHARDQRTAHHQFQRYMD